MAATPSTCLNCGAALTGAYCARCGQKAVNPDPTLEGFIHETTHELVHWDGKIPATLKTLFLRPGILTVDFLEGRRARWLMPLRVYLICSLAFFGGRVLIDELGLRSTREMAGVSIRGSRTGPLTPEERQQIAEGLPGRIIGVERLERAAADPKRFNREFEQALPRAMFILLPVFALLTNLGWKKVHPRYPAHLYVALHLHAVAFGGLLMLSLVAGLTGSAGLSMVAGIAFLTYLVWYFLRTLQLVFHEPWAKTIFKAGIVAGVYGICLFLVGMSLLAYAVSRF
jgi:hypothetical protein